ncbi:Alpha/Beta hydrolase protein [Flagelloscypha sp. PMI_526]|nr:Alpha/Beta hydrolase protein [Flagelloscypha sp. PMI_526]
MSFTRIVYSHLQGIPLEFELWLPTSTVPSQPLPVVIFFHGGGLMSGGKNDLLFATWLRDLSIQCGFAFIAADYPLLHPLTYKDIITQTKELFKFISSPSMNEHLPAGVAVNPERIAVTGFSAGAYVSRIAVIHAQPKPVALLSAFGMGGDFLNNTWVTGNKVYPGPVSQEAFLDRTPKPTVDSPILFDTERAAFTDAEGRWDAWLWLTVNGLFLDYLTGVQGISQQLSGWTTEKERYAKVTELGLAHAFPEIYLSEASNAAKFPPSFIYHGGADPLILPGESEKTFATLKEAGVEAELVVIPGSVHGMIDPATNQPKEGVAELQARAFEFISKELTK